MEGFLTSDWLSENPMAETYLRISASETAMILWLLGGERLPGFQRSSTGHSTTVQPSSLLAFPNKAERPGPIPLSGPEDQVGRDWSLHTPPWRLWCAIPGVSSSSLSQVNMSYGIVELIGIHLSPNFCFELPVSALAWLGPLFPNLQIFKCFVAPIVPSI